MYSIILASGIGSRFGGNIPKQFCILSDNKSILEYSIEKIQSIEINNQIIITIPQNIENYKIAYDIYLSLKEKYNNIIWIKGGDTRLLSSYRVIEYIEHNYNIENNHELILIHDAVRPFVNIDDINNLIDFDINIYDGAILGEAITDTLKIVNNDNSIKSTLDRNFIYKAQTPQIFKYNLYKKAISECIKNNEINITDDAGIMEKYSYNIKIIKSNSKNTKITYSYELSKNTGIR